MKILSPLHRNILSFAVGLSTLVGSQTAKAAESIVFRYGAFSETLSVPELTEFAQTGRQSSSVSYFLERTNQNPEAVRTALNREIPIRVTTLNRLLDSPVGNLALGRLSRTIQTPVDEANYQALRGALLVSVSQDNQLSLLEVFQNYPTRTVHIDGRELVSTYTEVSQTIQQIREIAEVFQ